MLQKLSAAIQGRAASYWLNAQADAELSQAIIAYLKSSPTLAVEDNRFDQLWELSQNSLEPKFFLAGCAYTLGEINGRMDYEVARFYALLSGFRHHLPPNYFSHASPTPFPLLTSWFLPSLKSQGGLRRFLQKQELALAGSTEVFIQAVMAIQEINIAHNRETIHAFAAHASPQIKQLRKLSKASVAPLIFMHAARQTQQSAIFWDKLFIKLLKW